MSSNDPGHKRDWEVIIVGAGPAGLATAFWLKKQGVDFCLLEKRRIGESWRNHYQNLTLHTLKENSGLPGHPMPDHWPKFVPGQMVADYLEGYARHFNFSIWQNTQVNQACFDNQHHQWQLETSRGRFSSRLLIVASGIWSNPHQPNFSGQASFPHEILHSQAYKNPVPFYGKRVLVVGGGNSGCEIAVEISEVARETAIVIPTGVTFVPYPASALLMEAGALLFRILPAAIGHRILKWSRPDFSHLGIDPPDGYLTEAYPVVGFELPKAVQKGRVKLVTSFIDHIDQDRVHFSNGQKRHFEAIILATGYRPTVAFLRREALELDRDGWPILKAGGQSTRQPALFCAGFRYPKTEGYLQALPRHSRAVAHAASAYLMRLREMFDRPDETLNNRHHN